MAHYHQANEYGNDGEYDTQFDKNAPYAPQGGRSQQQYVIIVADEEALDEVYGGYFSDPLKRLRFVRKILTIFGLQMLFLSVLVAICLFVQSVNDFFHTRGGLILMVICIVIFMFLHCAIACCRVGYGKPNGWNISLLIIATVTLSIFAAGVTIGYDVSAIMVAGVTTVALVGLFLVLTFFTKIDITDKLMYIIGAFFAVIIFSLISSILGLTGAISYSTHWIIGTVLCGIMVLIYAIMILYNLKMIVGGGKYEYTENDWLFASVDLFTDVVLFFLKLMELFQRLQQG